MSLFSKFLLLVNLFTGLLCGSLIGQVAITINITPDDFPQDIYWTLEDQEFEIIASGDLTGWLPGQLYSMTVENLEEKCYTFLITDRAGDGITGGGGYEIFYDNDLLVADYANGFLDRTYHHLNCGVGEVCETAITLNVPSPRKIYVPDTKDYWFSFTPKGTDAFYRVTMCTNSSLGVAANTALWLYDDCNRFAQTNDAEGSIAYSTEAGGDCGSGAEFNYMLLEGGTEYFIRHKPQEDWVNDPVNDSLRIKVDSLPLKPGCTDKLACNYDPFAYIDDGSCVLDSDCGPDLSFDQQALIESIEVDTINSNDQCLIEEGCLRGEGAREVIRFTTKIDNIGDADYVVGRPELNPNNFSRDNCHEHFHHQGYAEYLLFSGSGEPEPIGFKNGFCVLDLECGNPSLSKYRCNYMGVTAGCSDIYGSHIDCQWIDITDIADGSYTMVARINWNRLPDERLFEEKSYLNNWGQACVVIDRSSGALVVTVEDDCPEYVDCKGDVFGQAIVDCNGDCDGDAHFGDVDASGILETEDVDSYLGMLVNKIDIEGPCFDLNADGNISIYDAALAFQCVQENIREESNPFHKHCILPAGNERLDQFATIRSTEFVPSDGYMDLEISVTDQDIAAFQIATSGIRISSVEKLYEDQSDEFLWNDQEVFILQGSEFFARSAGFRPFVRIHFSEITADSICVTPASEIINLDYDRITVVLEDVCHFISATKDDISHSINYKLRPNPAKETLYISAADHEVTSIQIISSEGRIVSDLRGHFGHQTEVDVSTLPTNFYMVRIAFSNGGIINEKFLKI